MADIFDTLSQGGGDIFDQAATVPQESIPQMLGKNAMAAANDTYHNAYGAMSGAVNLFGLPQKALNAVHKGVGDAVFPEPTTNEGRLMHLMGGFVVPGLGAVKGAKIAGQVMDAASIAKTANKASVFEDAGAALGKRTKDLGQQIEKWHAGPGGAQIAPTNEVTSALKQLPANARDKIEGIASGIVDETGKPIYRLRDLQAMRNQIGRDIKEAGYGAQGPGNASQSDLIGIERELKRIINSKADDTLKNLDKAYGTFDRTAAEVRGALVNNKGNVVSKPLESIIRKADPVVMKRINEVSKEVPEVGRAIKVIKNSQRIDRIKDKISKVPGVGLVAGAAKKLLGF